MVARHVPQRRRILHELSIGKIAAVDRPCQEHARMTLMKRADNEDDVDKAWSDEARAAAAAARRRKGGAKPSSQLNVLAGVPRSELGDVVDLGNGLGLAPKENLKEIKAITQQLLEL